jgi:hypothetical protein
MNAQDRDSESPYTALEAKLQEAAEGLPMPPPWYEALLRLGPHSSDQERLAVYQAVRRAGTLPDEASFFLVSYLIDQMTAEEVGETLRDYEDRMEAIRTQYRLSDGGIWPAKGAPEEYDKLREEYYAAWDELFAERLTQLGEPEMAELLRADRKRFEALSDAGRAYFFGLDLPEDASVSVWLNRMVDTVTECMTADAPMGPMGYRYKEEDGRWEVDVYSTSVELIGGPVDGARVAAGFTVDVDRLRGAFDRIDGLFGHSQGFSEDEGPRLVIEGVYEGREVFLHVWAYAPEDEEPGMKLDLQRPEQ